MMPPSERPITELTRNHSSCLRNSSAYFITKLARWLSLWITTNRMIIRKTNAYTSPMPVSRQSGLAGRKLRGTNGPSSGTSSSESSVPTNTIAIRRPSVIIPKTTKAPTTSNSSSRAESPGNSAMAITS